MGNDCQSVPTKRAVSLVDVGCPVLAAPEPGNLAVVARNRIGLNAVHFFVADALGVAVPFVSTLLAQRHWRYDTIGLAIASVAIGATLLQAPVGFIADRTRHHRPMLVLAAVTVGLCFGLLPLLPSIWWLVLPILLISGIAQAFFHPLLTAVALCLAGHGGLNRIIGSNQSWNHFGNIAAALGALALASWGGIEAPLYAIGFVCLLAAGAVFLIEPDPCARNPQVHATGRPLRSLMTLCRERRLVILLSSVLLYSLANGPMLALAALYLRHLHGSDAQVAALVLVAQCVMIPLSPMAGRWCDRWGHKRILAISFLILPVRGFLYTLTGHPSDVVLIQILDGLAAGIFGVALIAVVADVTRGFGQFNAVNGLVATAGGLGGVIGPLLVGVLLQAFGFPAAFGLLAGVAALAAVLFCLAMPAGGGPIVPQTLSPLALPQLATATGSGNREARGNGSVNPAKLARP